MGTRQEKQVEEAILPMTCTACQFDHPEAVTCDCGAILCPYCKAEHECVVGVEEEDTVPELTLRAYQVATVNRTHEALRRVQRVIVVAPTGSGKRYLAVWWAKRIQERGRRVLIVTDRRLLVKQMYDELARFGVAYGIIMAGEPRWDAPTVQVASIQTLRSRHLSNGDGLPEADWLIVDEAHKEPVAYVKLFDYYPDAKIVGLTATPVGPEGRALV